MVRLKFVASYLLAPQQTDTMRSCKYVCVMNSSPIDTAMRHLKWGWGCGEGLQWYGCNSSRNELKTKAGEMKERATTHSDSAVLIYLTKGKNRWKYNSEQMDDQIMFFCKTVYRNINYVIVI